MRNYVGIYTLKNLSDENYNLFVVINLQHPTFVVLMSLENSEKILTMMAASMLAGDSGPTADVKLEYVDLIVELEDTIPNDRRVTS